MEARQSSVSVPKPGQSLRKLTRPADSFGVVLVLLLLDYIAISAVTASAWGRVLIVALLGATLLFALRTVRATHLAGASHYLSPGEYAGDTD